MYCAANSSCSSISTFTIFLFGSSSTTSSNIGTKLLQGPHQFAPKSTTTIPFAFNTYASKFSFVPFTIAILYPPKILF